MQRGSLRTSCGEPLCVLTLLFGKVFFRIHFALGLEGLPVPIERKSGLDPCLVGPPYGLELPLAPLQHRDVLLAGAQYGRRPHLADLRRAPGRHELRGVLGPPDLVRAHQRPVGPPRRTTSPPSRCRPAPRPRRSPRRAPRSPPRRRGTGGTGPCGPSSPGRTASASRRGCRPRRRPARGRRVSIRFACLAPFFPCSPGPGRRHTDGAR